jgi:hypothetical protein
MTTPANPMKKPAICAASYARRVRRNAQKRQHDESAIAAIDTQQNQTYVLLPPKRARRKFLK